MYSIIITIYRTRDLWYYLLVVTVYMRKFFMENGYISLFIIIFIVLSLNFYLLIVRRMKGSRSKKLGRTAVNEAKQAVWRDKEVQRRIDSEQAQMYEHVKLRNETLALYDEVRRRAAMREREGIETGKTDKSAVTHINTRPDE